MPAMDSIRRRALLLAALAIASTQRRVLAQAPNRVWRIGYLTMGTVESNRPQVEAAILGLAEHGLVVGRTVVLETRYAEGKQDRLPALVADLLAQNLDLVFAPSAIAAQAVKDSGTALPIVFSNAPDPVGQGFAASLARPGGTMTGLTSTHTELSAKRMQLLKEAFPSLRRVAILYFLAKSGAQVREQVAQTEEAAASLGMTTFAEESPGPDDFERAFAAIARKRPDALVVIENPVFFTHRARLTALAASLRVPAIYNVSEYARAGGLISYGASYDDLIRRACGHIAKILRGAPPGSLPIERPMKLELVVNARTAQAMGLALPFPLLMRADEVIQ